MSPGERIQIHATCVSIAGSAVLLRGASGSGKSDLALRLIDAGAVLVADDRVDLMREGRAVVASAPPVIAGRMEVRGLGIVELPALARAPVVLVVDLVAPDAVERMPEPETCRLVGVELPLVALAPFESSAPAKVKVALARMARTAAPAVRRIAQR